LKNTTECVQYSCGAVRGNVNLLGMNQCQVGLNF
jgi:hypothetical protein